MATNKSFEQLPVWQSAKLLAVKAYRAAAKGKLREDYGLISQIQKSAVSVSSNIAEGFERGSKREFIQFLYVAKGSCGELRSQLFVAKDIGYIDDADSKRLSKQARDVSRQIPGFIEYLKTSKFKGQKYQTKQSEI